MSHKRLIQNVFILSILGIIKKIENIDAYNTVSNYAPAIKLGRASLSPKYLRKFSRQFCQITLPTVQEIDVNFLLMCRIYVHKHTSHLKCKNTFQNSRLNCQFFRIEIKSIQYFNKSNISTGSKPIFTKSKMQLIEFMYWDAQNLC